MSDVEPAYLSKAYLGFALDPIHVGSGEHQLARVDNPIIREPGTNLPKIPATSLTGAIRAYTSLYYTNLLVKSGEKRAPENCAEASSLSPCTKPTCPVCVIFGFAEGAKGKESF
ncbi:MAG: RAMP superfamily CRISPR-associated protein [candidate division KSB1 bacterium]|nr:RAMP superfamily CRISPR-associated protein [candidate division KSB1 bacterium]